MWKVNRQTDGQVIRNAHLSFQLRWAKKESIVITRNVSETYMPPPWCKIQNYYCTRHYEFGTSNKAKININHIRVKDYIFMITHWAKNSGLALTFDHVTWKSIGKHLLFRGNPYTKISIIKWRGQKILSRKHNGPRTVNWPWPSIVWPENQ